MGLQTIQLDPVIAALLGTTTAINKFAATNWIPSGSIKLSRQFKNANFSAQYARTAVPGNGVYLTSRAETGTANYSYSGVQKATLNIGGGYTSLTTIGQGLAPYRSWTGGVGATYNVTHVIHAVARYDVRQQEIDIAGYRRSSYRVTLGIAFSPGTLPLSLWLTCRSCCGEGSVR